MKSRNCVRLLLTACLLSGIVLAQESRYAVTGTAVNAVTGEPVKRALVELSGFDTKPFSAQTFTDSGGTFHFEALSPGKYSVSAQKPQFDSQGDGVQELTLASTVNNLRLGLTPLGVVTGRVTDQEGDPVRNATVVALVVTTVAGARETKVDRTVATNDRGAYRLWNLRPGKYFVQAAGLGATSNLYAGDTTPLYLEEENFPPTFAGAGATLESAHPLEIRAGADMKADIQVRMERSFRIRGALGNFVPRRPVSFELWSGEQNVLPGRVSVNGDTGKFELRGVLPGSYLLIATEGDLTARMAITVRNSDLGDINLSLSPTVEIPVRTEFTNEPTASPVQAERLLSMGFCTPSLRSVSSRTPSAIARRRPGQNRQDSISNIAPGDYRLSITCQGAYPVSVRSGTNDLLANPVLTVQPGAEPPAIEITAAYGGGTVNGTLALEPGSEVTGAFILLNPQSVGIPRTVGVRRPNSAAGAGVPFSLSNLAPGDYTAYAFSSSEGVEYMNPQFLQSLPPGIPVHVAGDGTTTISIGGVVR